MIFPYNINAYKQTQNITLLSAEPNVLLDTVLEEIYISIKSAENLFLEKNMDAARLSIDRSIELIQEGLIAYLDRKYKIADQLLLAYQCIIMQLVKGNSTNNVEHIQLAGEMIDGLRQSFKMAANIA
jgi:flagellin-specific chaperone FliS